MVFFIRLDGRKMVPVFVQCKLHQSSATLYQKLWEKALTTVSASCIQDHAKDFQNFCPNNIYISMVVAYPMVCGARLPPAVEVPKKDACDVQQVVTHVSDTNFSQIFPKELVKFIDRLKNAGKRAADDVDSDDDDLSAKRVRVIPVFEYSTCNLTDNHQELKLMIRDADAIFWDEAPMQLRYIFEAVHRTV
ncbi:hypothetical protein BGZ97_009605 [Linnemannia gamsii]|uniref:Uncharacterized protein n=1 Tax=Linnemannia gamsii TaxID=64522 RepID=A0A9P6QL85_9FUNG|nr:hypothetical protein BGZ97_009605 [Linnemannia gamsii]